MNSTGIVCYGMRDLRLESIELTEPAADEAVVSVRFGGICGSDLHYWAEGRVGASVIQEPLILGHEIVGTVDVAAADGSGPSAGTAVFIHPATVCGQCEYCATGRYVLCSNLRYLGSAARLPHTNGGFATRLIVPSNRLLSTEGIDPIDAALIEPASVAWHAVGRVTAVGRKVAGRIGVIGSGPIGLLTLAALRARNPEVEVMSTDLFERPLALARSLGAAHTAIATDAETALRAFRPDIVFETSGSGAGFDLALRVTAPGGVVVAVGQLPPAVPSAIQLIVAGELIVVGSSRFFAEAYEVIDAMRAGTLDVTGIVSHVVDAREFERAFALAADSSQSSKTLLDFGAG